MIQQVVKYSVIKALILALILMLLTVRTGEYIVEGVSDGLVGQNPYVLLISRVALQLAVLLLIALVVISFDGLRAIYFLPSIYCFSIIFYIFRVSDFSDVFGISAGVISWLSLMYLFARYNADEVVLSWGRESILAIVLFSLIYTVVGLVLLVRGEGYFLGGGRFAGVSFHPNQFGLIAAICVLVNLYGFFNFRIDWIRRLYLLLSVGAFYLVISSGSRGALLALVVSFSVFTVAQRIPLSKLIPLILLGFVGFIVFLVYSEFGEAVKERIVNTGDNRTDVLKGLFVSFLESPLYGVGGKAIGSENSLLKAMAVGGVICALPLLLYYIHIIYLIFASIVRARSGYYSSYSSELSVCAGVASLIVVGSMFDGYMFEKLGVCGPILLILGMRMIRLY